MKIAIRGELDARAVAQLERCMQAADAPLGALCADHHVGYSMPIGGVIGYREHVSPTGVGFDVGCGNLAVQTNLRADDVPVSAIMDEIVRRVDFGMGTRAGNEAGHLVLDRIQHAEFVPQRGLLELARNQLGTVGSGNHYVDLFRDEDGQLWVGVHFGSRGFGHKTTTGFLAMAAGGKFADKTGDGDMDSPPTLLAVSTELGQSYIAAANLAADYAYAGREVVVGRVLDILGAEALDSVHAHHNHFWHEEHIVDGQKEKLWVVRKGATPAFSGQRGFVGATMAEPAVILEGAQPTDQSARDAQEALMYSTVHGAGRVMSRTAAAGRKKPRWACSNRDCDWFAGKGEHKPADGTCPKCGNARLRKVPIQLSRGKIDWRWTLAQLEAKGIELRGAAADEAPLAYKRLADVLNYHAPTINILHTLEPIGVAMAGSDVEDRYKD